SLESGSSAGAWTRRESFVSGRRHIYGEDCGMTTVDDRGLDPSDAQRGAPKRAPADASPGTGVNRWKWQNVYVKRLYLTDAITVVLSVILAQTVRFGYEDLLLAGGGGQLDYTVVSAVLIVAWLGALSLFRSRSRRVIGAGYDEYQRV